MSTDKTTRTASARPGDVTKRDVLGLAVGAAAATIAAPAIAQTPRTIKIGTVLPLSGPLASIGQTIKDGVDFGIDDVNQAGGIKALGGAKLELVAADAEESPEKAKNAAQRLLSREPDLVGGIGDAVSGMTSVITELTEKAELPWITQTLADALSERGLKYFFHSTHIASTQAQLALPTVIELAKAATGKAPQTCAIIADTNQALQGIVKTWREGEAAKNGLKILSERSYSPPLSDPTQLIEELRRSRPDFAFLMAITVADLKLMLDKLQEFGLGRGKLPAFAFAGVSGTPELLRVAGAENLENFCGIFSNWPGKRHEQLAERFKARSGKPWMTGQVLDGYGQVMIYRDALEKAGVADRRKVAEEIRKMSTAAGAGEYFTGALKWDERGRRTDASLVVIQWQGGVPRLVHPGNIASAKPVWLGRV